MDTWKAEPCTKHQWGQLIRAAPLPIITKGIGLIAATYANSDGTSVRPTIEKLMEHSELSKRAVQEHMSLLRGNGWLILVKAGTGGRGRPSEAAVYRLSFPAEVTS